MPTPTYTLGLHRKKASSDNDQSTKVDFFHLGAMDWLPNQDGINWILKDVFPKVKQTEKSAEIHLAGKPCPQLKYTYKMVTITMVKSAML